jgi:hypothetical protein
MFDISKDIVKSCQKYDKQDQQGKAELNERIPHTTSNKNQLLGAQTDPKQNQDRAQDKARIG